ncbi:hypothetical protein P7K49_023794 [Saguinus oedipus]|uniref:Uncharacterized protein n=1 Tax=Saguinus oedipus TaxID=9490 RepID=A0ABQ9UMP4_SAGOE|nr:hypothetical protein P7K49_023794 [Saguinus oedipus]
MASGPQSNSVERSHSPGVGIGDQKGKGGERTENESPNTWARFLLQKGDTEAQSRGPQLENGGARCSVQIGLTVKPIEIGVLLKWGATQTKKTGDGKMKVLAIEASVSLGRRLPNAWDLELAEYGLHGTQGGDVCTAESKALHAEDALGMYISQFRLERETLALFHLCPVEEEQ